MDSKDSFNKLGCHSSTFGTLHTVQGFKPKYTNHFCSLLFGQHKKKKKKKNKVQKRKATSNSNNAFHMRPKFGGKRPAITLTQKSQTVSFKVNHQTKKPKNKTILWTVWSVYFVDHGYEVSSLNRKKKKRKKKELF